MNTLNMPGFTAETSLYKNRTSYRMMADGNGNDSSGVIPQRKWLKCAAAIGAQTAACLAGPNPVCLIAAANSANVCL